MGKELICVQNADLGSHPEALALNTSFRRDTPILKLCVEINWEPTEPAVAVASLEARLVKLCPSLREHECRGQEEYHILSSGDERGPRFAESRRTVEAPLALAHLYEHVMIDTIAFITAVPLVSGATGALKDARNRFDIFVESPDAVAARLTVGLATSWFGALVTGRSLNGEGRVALDLARHFYRNQSGALEVGGIARALGRESREVGEGLSCLERNGLTNRVGYTVNLSGVMYFSLPGAETDLLATGR